MTPSECSQVYNTLRNVHYVDGVKLLHWYLEVLGMPPDISVYPPKKKVANAEGDVVDAEEVVTSGEGPV